MKAWEKSEDTQICEILPEKQRKKCKSSRKTGEKTNRCNMQGSKALEILPQSAETYNNRGIVYSQKGQYDNALSDFTEALKIKPSNAKAYYNRGITYAIKNQYDLALSDLRRSIEISPSEAGSYDILGTVHAALACLEWGKACGLGNCDHLKEAIRAGFCSEPDPDGTLSP
jgi:tetratricopeptide (TPR) repeat protein